MDPNSLFGVGNIFDTDMKFVDSSEYALWVYPNSIKGGTYPFPAAYENFNSGKMFILQLEDKRKVKFFVTQISPLKIWLKFTGGLYE